MRGNSYPCASFRGGLWETRDRGAGNAALKTYVPYVDMTRTHSVNTRGSDVSSGAAKWLRVGRGTRGARRGGEVARAAGEAGADSAPAPEMAERFRSAAALLSTRARRPAHDTYARNFCNHG